MHARNEKLTENFRRDYCPQKKRIDAIVNQECMEFVILQNYKMFIPS
jgi:hypothetical protein